MKCHHFQSELVLVVDDPNKNEAIALDVMQGHMLDLVVRERRVSNRHTSSWVSCREHPRRVHADDVEQTTGVLHLLTTEIFKLVFEDICKDGHAPELLRVNISDDFELIIVDLNVRIEL